MERHLDDGLYAQVYTVVVVVARSFQCSFSIIWRGAGDYVSDLLHLHRYNLCLSYIPPHPHPRYRALLGFVRRVPRRVLVKASMRVRAYTRALRYLEEQIREEHTARRKATGRSVSYFSTGIYL